MSGLLCTISCFFFSVIFIQPGITHGSPCCDSIANDDDNMCRDACHKLTEAAGLVEQIQQLSDAKSLCGQHEDKLWQCAERKLAVLQELGTIPGRPCQHLAKTRSCREACNTAKSEREIEEQCSRSTEDGELFECISRQKNGEKCCGKTITSDNFVCVATCWNLYLTNTVALSGSRRELRQQCGGRNKNVVQCVQRQTRSVRPSNHAKVIHCCQMTMSSTCRAVCEEALQSEGKGEEKYELVTRGCGKPALLDPLWQCLLKEDSEPVEPQDMVRGFDSAKLHCCDKAQSPICGSLCVKTHLRNWDKFIHKFEKNCVYTPSSISTTHESKMHVCLKEVEEPCKMGCNGLSFCKNMNNRPTELFRSCNADADEAARMEILLWQQGTVMLPGAEIPIKDIRKCEPEMWKAISCAYQIKPCYKNPASPQICLEDCMYIMHKCVETTQLQNSMIQNMCKRLPPAASGNCTSIKQYLYAKPVKTESFTTPCQPNTCDSEREVCLIHRRKCHNKEACKTHICKKGCKLGHASKLVVPHNTNVLVPTFKDSEISSSCQRYKVCHCSHTSELSKCQSMRCLSKTKCVISPGVRKAHGEFYQNGCNQCICFGGETICSRRHCSVSTTNISQIGILGCDCAREYSPVCGGNGKTYPNTCVARCVGQTDVQAGACSSRDPCKNDTCAEGYRCVRQQSVCIGQRHDQCLQYMCVKLDDCNEHLHQPVCDTAGVEHTNECILLAKKKTLAYRGHCLKTYCQMKGQVCGHDGETYDSECAALAARTTIDYLGGCRTVGSVAGSDDFLRVRCDNVICQPIALASCLGIIPPWGCCPVCATELHLLYSESMARDLTAAVKKGPIKIGDTLETLSTHMSVSDCDIFGYLSLDGEIIVLVAPVSTQPTKLQIAACITEAERLKYVINSRSPLLSSNMLLTSFLHATLSKPELAHASGVVIYTQCYSVILTLALLHFTQRIMGYL